MISALKITVGQPSLTIVKASWLENYLIRAWLKSLKNTKS